MNNDQTFEIEFLHPKILVFKNAFTDGQNLIKHFEDNFPDQWVGWYSFGTKIELNTVTGQFDSFPTQDQWNQKIIEKQETEMLKDLLRSFYLATKEYYNHVNLKLDNWFFDAADIAKYNENSGIPGASGTVGMNYHTDFEQSKALEPGSKFATTCVFYLNDDYDGGEICFKIFNEDFTEIEQEIVYKPSAGDAVIFPSTHPFYHGVNVSTNGCKYIVRSYWKYMYEGDQDYLNEKSKFSDDVWQVILKERGQEVWNKIQQKLNM